MAQIFVSHSKRDHELVTSISSCLRSANIQPILEEFTPETTPPYAKIYSDMRNSEAAFLLLSPNVTISPHTQNWICYEVGLAHAFNKPVYVFEQIDCPINFPVPYVSDYVVYDPKNASDWTKIESIAKNHDPSPMLANVIFMGLLGLVAVGTGAAAILAGALGAAMTEKPYKGPFRQVHCYKCGIVFRFHSTLSTLNCPSCRTPLMIK